jgi:hypothetical protein
MSVARLAVAAVWSDSYNVCMSDGPPESSQPTLQHVEGLQSAAFEAISLGRFGAARRLVESVILLGFCGPALLLAHAWSCAHLGDLAAAARSLDAAVARSDVLTAAQRTAFDATFSSVAAMVSGHRWAAQA